MKAIHFNLYDPTSGLHLFGKPKASEPTQYQYIECSNCDNCSLYKVGQCAAVPVLFGSHCPYGSYRRVGGPTKRAKGFYAWQNEARKKFEGVPYLKHPPKKLAIVGDYVYVPYSHINMNESLPFENHGGFMRTGTEFLKVSDFTVENIQRIVDFRPQALMGGEIRDYQKEEMPKFMAHLQEIFPQLFAHLIDVRPDYVERFGLNKPKNYVGRTALLKTIAPCTFLTSGSSREGKYKVKWTWDGTNLSTNKEDGHHVYNATWGEVDGFSEMTFVAKPSDKTKIKITNNEQVNSNTVFID